MGGGGEGRVLVDYFVSRVGGGGGGCFEGGRCDGSYGGEVVALLFVVGEGKWGGGGGGVGKECLGLGGRGAGGEVCGCV